MSVEQITGLSSDTDEIETTDDFSAAISTLEKTIIKGDTQHMELIFEHGKLDVNLRFPSGKTP